MGSFVTLAVDDEPLILTAINRLLKPHCQILTAESGAAGLDLLRNNHVDVIVSDQRMPEMSGVEFLAQAKKIAPTSVRVLLTGYSDLPAIQQAINEGEIFRFIQKPWKNEEFVSLVEKCGSLAQETQKIVDLSKSQQQVDDEIDKSKGKIEFQILPELLLLDSSQQLLPTVTQICSGKAHVRPAGTSDEALKIIDQYDIAIVVVVLPEDPGELTLLKTLKGIDPRLLILVISSTDKADQLIELINEGQVFRYISFPLRVGLMKMYLFSALRYSRQLRFRPALAKRHVADAIRDPTQQRLSIELKQKLGRFNKRLARLFG